MIRSKILVLCCVIAGTALLAPAEALAQMYPPPYRYDLSASLRIQVEPKETEVFIDGYWAGIVDDFDGFFQRLHLEPGDHDIELFLEGHRTFRQKIYLQPHGTFTIRHEMQRLGPGEAPDPRPASTSRQPPERAERSGRYERREGSERSSFGTLAIRVQPADAEIVIDGQAWDRSGGVDRFEIDLAAGEHRIEIRKDGFESYVRSIRVRPGETTTINVSLARE